MRVEYFISLFRYTFSPEKLGREANYHDLLRFAMLELKPKRVLELGTGEGGSGAVMMLRLRLDSTFTTINWPNPPSGDDVGVKLRDWHGDPRFRQILGDTREVADQVEPGVDLMFVDSGTKHTLELVSEEWRLYEPKLANEAVVIFDDIGVNDMPVFWVRLPHDKALIDFGPNAMGVLMYRRK